MEQKIKIPVRKATQAIYNALATKNAGIIYILTDVAERNNLFLGDIPLGKVCRQPVKYVLFDRTAQLFTFAYADGTAETVDLILDGEESILPPAEASTGGNSDSARMDTIIGTLQEMAAAMLTKMDTAIGLYKPAVIELCYPEIIVCGERGVFKITHNILPQNANQKVIFLANNDTLTVMPNGELVANRPGNCSIYAISAGNPDVYEKLEIQVVSHDLRLNSNSLRLAGNGSLRIT
jgi:hypothetical protein